MYRKCGIAESSLQSHGNTRFFPFAKNANAELQLPLSAPSGWTAVFVLKFYTCLLWDRYCAANGTARTWTSDALVFRFPADLLEWDLSGGVKLQQRFPLVEKHPDKNQKVCFGIDLMRCAKVVNQIVFWKAKEHYRIQLLQENPHYRQSFHESCYTVKYMQIKVRNW